MLRSTGQVAVIDEDSGRSESLLAGLADGTVHGIDSVVRHAAQSALETIPGSPVICVLLDPAVSNGSGLELLADLRRAGVDAATVCLASAPSVALAAECMRAGADDYVSIEGADTDLVGRVVRHAIERVELRREATRYARDLELRNAALLARRKRIMGFYHTIAHEIATPLASVGRLLSRMRDGRIGDWSEEQLRFIEDALHGHRGLERITHDLRLLSRLDRGLVEPNVEEVSLGTTVAAVLEAFEASARDKGVALEADLDGSTVAADEELFAAVLRRLVHNALKYTPRGGTITVAARPESRDSVTITVRDTGRGIAPEDQGRIFDRLRKGGDLDPTLQPGLGLGLSLCKELVRLHGGTLWLNSIPGNGSTFFFTLPMGVPTAP